jgi:mono/diheme cytochrome c family protein
MRLVKPLLVVIALTLPTTGCQQKMALQPSYKPLDPSHFFDNGQSAQPTVPGTVARGHLRTDFALFTGQRAPNPKDRIAGVSLLGIGGTPLGAVVAAAAYQPDYVKSFPFPVTREVMQHGQNRYMIYCVVCHDPLGTGRGKIVERGYTAPPSYHIQRLRDAPVGYFFDVITRGYGSMPSYGQQIPPRDRWAITAYIRALQLSQHFPEKELTDAMREQLARAERPPAEGGERR